ncbi:MAG: hypothetical protein U0T75_14300 [Chitinophagales bacterium]
MRSSNITRISFCFLAVLIMGCNHKTGTAPSTIKAKDLNGAWLKLSYIDTLRSTKSPLLSHKQLRGFSELQFNLENDTVAVYISLGNHEGDWLSIDASSYPFVLKVSGYSDLFDGDTSVLVSIEKDTLFLRNKKKVFCSYLRWDTLTRSSVGVATHRFTNGFLFGGNYHFHTNKSQKQDRMVRFSPDGKLIGLPVYDAYDVVTDFLMAEDTVDLLAMYRKNKVEPELWRYWLGDTIVLANETGDSIWLY